MKSNFLLTVSCLGYVISFGYMYNGGLCGRRVKIDSLQQYSRRTDVRPMQMTTKNNIEESNVFIGEDAAAFSLQKQSIVLWAQFGVAVGSVLGFLYYVWVYNSGPLLGDRFTNAMEYFASGDSTVTIVLMLGFFAVCHSGMASARPYGEKLVGPRVWRYLFALVSLPLAFSSIVYFINHR